MPRYLISFGSSSHQANGYLLQAKTFFYRNDNIKVCATSKLYANPAKYTHYNCLFYNCVLATISYLNPQALYNELAFIERSLGRLRPYKNARRTIDLDILMSLDFTYNNGNLVIPHKDFLNRDFFITPATEALRLAKWPLPFELTHLGKLCLKF